MDEIIGRTLNRFKIVEKLGEGGLGAVFRARDTVLERNVAVKVMRPDLPASPALPSCATSLC